MPLTGALRIAQVPRCRDLAVFVVTTDDYFTPAHARGVKTLPKFPAIQDIINLYSDIYAQIPEKSVEALV